MRTSRPVRRSLVASAALLALAALAGCASPVPGSAASSTSSSRSADPVSGELTVYAAASLGAAFDELADRFERPHPSVEVRPISYDGSSTLATQLIEGAPADVFASADEKNMQKVVDAGLVDEPALFATNTLVIAVPAGNPAGIEGIEDLAAPDVTVALCAPEVPCGAASATLLADNAVTVTPVSLEQNVTAVLTKVETGEVDAGLVYVTDVRGVADLEEIEASGAAQVVNRYPIAALDGSANPQAAAAFVAFVLSSEGQDVLASFGFGAP